MPERRGPNREEVLDQVKSKIREAKTNSAPYVVVWEAEHYETNGFGDDFGDLTGLTKGKWEALVEIIDHCREEGMRITPVFEYGEESKTKNIYPPVPYVVERTKISLVATLTQTD